MQHNHFNNFLKNTIALVIDDEINKENSPIFKIVAELEKKGTIFLKREEIKENEKKSLRGISYLIFDWQLDSNMGAELGKEKSELNMGDELEKEENERKTKYLQDIIKLYNIPIFIISNKSSDYIKQKLIVSDPTISEKIDKLILIIDKGPFEKIEEKIEKFFNDNKTILVLKKFEENIKKVTNVFFDKMINTNKDWASCIYNKIKGDNLSFNSTYFHEFLTSSFTNYINFVENDYDFLDEKCSNQQEEILQELYINLKYYNFNDNPSKINRPGDLFILKSKDDGDNRNDKEYILRISSECDMRKEKHFFVLGKLCKSSKNNRNNNDNKVEVYNFLHFEKDKKIRFELNNFYLIEISEENSKVVMIGDKKYEKVGKILVPYIYDIQRKFAIYISRFGFFPE